MKTFSLRSIPVRRLLKWAGLAASSFYYKRSERPQGVRPTTHSVNEHGQMVENKIVVQQIEKVLSQEFCCYGYKNMTAELREMGWVINHKKVYRLMKESKLLYGSRIRPIPFKRDFIRFRSLQPERPLQYLSMDIKYVYIHGTGRNVLLLTVIDIYSRKVLIYLLRSHIKKGDVLLMLSLMLLEYKAEGMSIRNDNGSQFIAQAVREYLKEKGIYQEFSHVATPEDNVYIEAFHSNLQREVMDRYEFDSIYHAQMVLDRYYEWYNEKRRHGALKRQTPNYVFKNFNPVPFENEKLLSYL
ncbi:IS3 family transposase [Chitinophaga costaii]|nr:IS3 family transposase [Chitinophaga costaii]